MRKLLPILPNCFVKSAPFEFTTHAAISERSALAELPILPAEHPIGCNDRTDDAGSALFHLLPTQIIGDGTHEFENFPVSQRIETARIHLDRGCRASGGIRSGDRLDCRFGFTGLCRGSCHRPDR